MWTIKIIDIRETLKSIKQHKRLTESHRTKVYPGKYNLTSVILR